MQRIFADFNKLGLHGDGNVVDLGFDDSPALVGHKLCDGERAIFYETGSLEAMGTLASELVEGRRYWLAVLDMSTLKHLDAQ